MDTQERILSRTGSQSTGLAAAVVSDAAKAAPPVGVNVAHYVFGIPLSEWLMGLTIAYTVLQIYVLVRDKIVRRQRED